MVLEKTPENPLGSKEIESFLMEINPEYSLEGLMLKLKLQDFGHLHLLQTAGLLEKSLMLGKIEGRTRRGRQRMRWLDCIKDSMNMNLGKLQEMIASWQESDDKPRLCVEKQRDYSADKGLYSQGYGFPVVTYSCESWTIKKAEYQRIDAFKLWCRRRLLTVP